MKPTKSKPITLKIQHLTADRDLAFVILDDGQEHHPDFQKSTLTLEDGLTYKDLVDGSQGPCYLEPAFYEDDSGNLLVRRITDWDDENTYEPWKGYEFIGGISMFTFTNTFEELVQDETWKIEMENEDS